MVFLSQNEQLFLLTALLPARAENIYMLFTGWEVRTGKIFCRGLKNGPRPKAEGRF